MPKYKKFQLNTKFENFDLERISKIYSSFSQLHKKHFFIDFGLNFSLEYPSFYYSLPFFENSFFVYYNLYFSKYKTHAYFLFPYSTSRLFFRIKKKKKFLFKFNNFFL